MSDKTQLITSLDFAYDAIQHGCYNDALSSILEAKEAAQQILDICQPQCKWEMANDGFYDVWESTCGNSFVLNEGSPEDNEMNYCSHCGGKLIQPPPEDTA